MLPFKHYGFSSLDKILQEGPQDSSLGTAPLVCPLICTPLHNITVHMTRSLRPSPSIFTCTYCEQSKTGQRQKSSQIECRDQTDKDSQVRQHAWGQDSDCENCNHEGEEDPGIFSHASAIKGRNVGERT